MNYRLTHPLLYGLILLPFFLTGQGFDLAFTYRYNAGRSINGIEPAENGFRKQTANSFFLEFEFRRNEKIGWLLSFATETIKTGKSEVTVGDVIAPFNMVHPYSSNLEAIYLQLGAQYNFRILEGDLSIGFMAGPGVAYYRRDWDVLNLLVNDGQITTRDPGFTTFTDESKATFRLRTAARLQYTYWISPQLAFSTGVEYAQSHYLGGGIETTRGERYEIDTREFLPDGFPSGRQVLIYNINYDPTTLMPDPSTVINQFQLTLAMTSRIGAR